MKTHDWGNLTPEELEAIFLALIFINGQDCVYPEHMEIVERLISELEEKLEM
jgi:hypothetical protein